MKSGVKRFFRSNYMRLRLKKKKSPEEVAAVEDHTAVINGTTNDQPPTTNSIVRTAKARVEIFPVLEHRWKRTSFYLVFQDGLCELHKDQKTMKTGKPPKHVINLDEAFNVSLHTEPIRIGKECISIMTTTDTYYLLPLEGETTDWYESILEKARENRSSKLLRPVFREEYFEASWDVIIVRKPKLRKVYECQETLDDLGAKFDNVLGRRRICISPNALALFPLGIEPNSSSDEAPYDKTAYIDLPTNVVSSYGKQEKYFFLRLGRCSKLGSGELWMETESGSVASNMHETISKINQRESEKRRTQGAKVNFPGLSARALKNQQHRERSQAQQRSEKFGDAASLHEYDKTVTKENNQLTHADRSVASLSSKKDSANLETIVNALSKNSSVPEKGRINEMKLHSSSSFAATPTSNSALVTVKKNSVAGIPTRLSASKAHERPRSSTASSLAIPYSAQSATKENAVERSCALPNSKAVKKISKTATSMNSKQGEGSLNSYNCTDDYMDYDAKIDSRKTSVISGQPARQISIPSTAPQTPRLTTLPQDYLAMDVSHEPSHHHVDTSFPLDEVRSYVSNSAESCFSSTCNAMEESRLPDGPRAFSLGSKPLTAIAIGRSLLRKPEPPVVIRAGENSAPRPLCEEELSPNDLRKRSHSLGTKSWLKPPMRRGLQMPRTVTAEGISTACDNIEGRMRSDSTSSSCSRRNQSETGDHMEMDFESKRDGASIDSPANRSRNSSLGVQMPISIRSALDLALVARKAMEQPDKSVKPTFEKIDEVLSRKSSVPDVTQLESGEKSERLRSPGRPSMETSTENKKGRNSPAKDALYNTKPSFVFDDNDDYVVIKKSPHPFPSSSYISDSNLRMISTILETASSSGSGRSSAASSSTNSQVPSRSASRSGKMAHRKNTLTASAAGTPKVISPTSSPFGYPQDPSSRASDDTSDYAVITSPVAPVSASRNACDYAEVIPASRTANNERTRSSESVPVRDAVARKASQAETVNAAKQAACEYAIITPTSH